MDYQIERYGLIFWTRGGQVGFDTRKEPEGDWVRHVEYTAALAEAQAEIARLRALLAEAVDDLRGPIETKVRAVLSSTPPE